MKLNVPGGVIEVEPVDYSLEEAERTIRIVTSDGAILYWRPTVAMVGRRRNGDDEWEYHVVNNASTVKIS